MMKTSNKPPEKADKIERGEEEGCPKDEVDRVLDAFGTCGWGKRELHVWFHRFRYYEVE